MLAHLSYFRLVRGNVTTGPEYERTSWRWSGPQAEGDELNDPVCAVVDVGASFTINTDRKLVVHGKAHEWTPERLLNTAYCERYGFKVLYDARHDDVEAEEVSA